MSNTDMNLYEHVDRVEFWQDGPNWRFVAYDRALDLLHDVVDVDDNATEQQARAELARQWPDVDVQLVAFGVCLGSGKLAEPGSAWALRATCPQCRRRVGIDARGRLARHDRRVAPGGAS